MLVGVGDMKISEKFYSTKWCILVNSIKISIHNKKCVDFLTITGLHLPLCIKNCKMFVKSAKICTKKAAISMEGLLCIHCNDYFHWNKASFIYVRTLFREH